MTMISGQYHIDQQYLVDVLKKRPQLVQKYAQADPVKSRTQIVNTFIPFLLLRWLAYLSVDVSLFLTAVISAVNGGFFLGRMLIIQHDCSHLSFVSSKKLNIIIGNVCSVFTLIPFKYRQAIHNLHHRYNGVLDDDVRDIGSIKTMNVREYKSAGLRKKYKYRIARHRISLFVIGPFYYFLVAQRLPLRTFPNDMSIIVQQMITTIVTAVMIYMAGTRLGRFPFLLIHGVSFFVFGVLTIWMFYVQHQHEHAYREYKHERQYLLAALRGSSFYDLPPILHRATGYIGYHHIHHLCVTIPNYNLKQCHDENPILLQATEVLNIKKSLSLIHSFLWDEDAKHIISFSEYKKIYG